MRTLKFIVNGQELKKDPACDFSRIVKGTKGYLKVSFSLSSEWSGCKVAASFWKLNAEHAVPVIGNECEIPEEVLTYENFYVQLTGVRHGYRIKTTKVLVTQEG